MIRELKSALASPAADEFLKLIEAAQDSLRPRNALALWELGGVQGLAGYGGGGLLGTGSSALTTSAPPRQTPRRKRLRATTFTSS